jgi:hypothetical protein
MHAVNYTFGALWGGWLSFWLASARGNKRTATRTGLLWRFTGLAAVLVVWLGLRQFPAYFEQPLLPPSAAWVYMWLVLTGRWTWVHELGAAGPWHKLECDAKHKEGP